MKIKYFIIVSSIILTIVLTACANKKQEELPEQAISVKILTISKKNIDTGISYTGVVEEFANTFLSFQVPGNVERVFVSVGEQVKQGQLLAALKKDRLQINYEIRLSSLKEAQDAYDRLKILYDNKSLPEIKIIEAESNLEQAKSLAKVAKKDLDDCKLYAPFSGIIGTRSVEQGLNVDAGTPILSLLNIGKVKIKIAIPEKDISGVKVAQPASIFISTLNTTFSGKIIEKGIVSNPQTYTYDIRICLDNPQQELLPGMLCDVTLSIDRQLTYNIPISALQITHDRENYVWIVDKENVVHLRSVTIGGIANNEILILDGLQDNDQIITEGYLKISAGSKVVIQNSK